MKSDTQARLMVTDDERALVWGALAAHRAWRERASVEHRESIERERWFYASSTRDEAIERGTQCYLATVRASDEAPPEPLRDVHVDALRAMVRAGELSVQEARLVADGDSSNPSFDVDFWCASLSSAAIEQGATLGEIPHGCALTRGVVPPRINDDVLTDALIEAWDPTSDGAAQRAALQRVSRERLIEAMRVRLRVTERGFGEDTPEEWMNALYDNASVAALSLALLDRDDRRVAELSERLLPRRLALEPMWQSQLSEFDEREAICAQLCRYGHHALALVYFDAVVRDPVAVRTAVGPGARGLPSQLLSTLRECLAPEALAERVERAIETYASRDATAGQWLSLAQLASTNEQRTALVERARVAFDAGPCLLDASLIPAERRGEWIAVIERRIDAWIEVFAAQAYGASSDVDRNALSAVLQWVDHADASMVRSCWPSLTRLGAAARASPMHESTTFERWLHRAALHGSDEARAYFRDRIRPRKGLVRDVGYDLFSPDKASPAAQSRWIDRVIREAPGATRVLEFARPNADQMRAMDFARIESGRESLWNLVTDGGVASREARAVVFDRWYRGGCPIDGEGWYRQGDLVALKLRAQREAPCERRTRWLDSRDELLAWIEALDVVRDDSWRCEPGLRWLVETLDGDERGRAQLRRLLDERIAALRELERFGAQWSAVRREVLSLLSFASEEQARSCLGDAALVELLDDGAGDAVRTLVGVALRSGLTAASTLMRSPLRTAIAVAIDTARGVAAFAEECAQSIPAALALIETYAQDVRALSDDWRAEIERWVCSDENAARRRYLESDDALKSRMRPRIEGGDADERWTRWLLEDDEYVIENLALFAPTPEHAPCEYTAIIHRLGGAAAIDAIGDVLVDWLVEEQR
ncbi:MAG: hypothetical protein U0269_33910 [Polyangiales bacterium]